MFFLKFIEYFKVLLKKHRFVHKFYILLLHL